MPMRDDSPPIPTVTASRRPAIRRLAASIPAALAVGLLVVLGGLSLGCWCDGFDCDTAHWGDDTPGSSAVAAGVSRVVASGQTLFIPGAAHVSGANGTNWRSDL
ncbi:MAG TPA: hypothetical protein ENK19_01935, partial [Acidobacteria bacterium]|nr:hypothetical protein [Acidobacteriota bacterium]